MNFRNIRVLISGVIIAAFCGLWGFQVLSAGRPHPSVELLGPIIVLAAGIVFFGEGVVKSAVTILGQQRSDDDETSQE